MSWINGRVDDLAPELRKTLIAEQRGQSRRYAVILFLAAPMLLLIGGVSDLLLGNPHAWTMLPWRIALSMVTATLAVVIRSGWSSDRFSAASTVFGIGLIHLCLALSTLVEPSRTSMVYVVTLLLSIIVLPLTIRLRDMVSMVVVLVLPLLGLLAWRHESALAWCIALTAIALGVWAGLFMRRQRLEIALEVFELRRQLEVRASQDMLTGLYNREGWFRSAQEAFTMTRDAHKPMSLAYLDLDHFKRINDDFDHATGDIALASVADMLRRHSRRQDVIGRLGGEEFVLLMPGVNAQTAVQLVQALCEAAHAVPAPHAITFSAGVCQVRLTDSLESAVRRADHALLRAKREGRDRVVCAD